MQIATMFEPLIAAVRDHYGTTGLVPLHAPVFGGKEEDYVAQAVRSTFVSSVGAFVDRFEADMAAYTGAGRAVAVVNGTAALHMALILADVGAGDLVITLALPFVATCNVIAYCGAEPVFCDVDAATIGLSPEAVEAWLTENASIGADGLPRMADRVIRACVPMHSFGHPVRLTELMVVCARWGITLIEEAAESLGSTYHGQHTGTFGRIGTQIFNGNKILTTGGGGMILTDAATGARAKHLTTTAKQLHSFEYVHDEVGYNYRLPNLNAALGVAQLERLDGFVTEKRALAAFYRTELGDTLNIFAEPEGCRSNYWLNAVICDDAVMRDAMLAETNAAGVMTRPIWALMTRLPMHRSALRGPFDLSEWLAARVVNIPSGIWGGEVMRKVAVFTGSRAEYGLLSRLVGMLRDDPAVEMQVIAGAIHYAPEFGQTWRAIVADGHRIDAKVESLLASDTASGVVKSLGLGAIGMADAPDRLMPNMLVILGDRFESLAAAQAALIMGIPIAHIHGGEITEGAYDDAIRHAITKMASWHFVAAEAYRDRVIPMGTPPDRVFTVSAPGLDGLVSGEVMSVTALSADLGLALDRPYLLATYHPATSAEEDAVVGLGQVLEALDEMPEVPVIITYPNADNDGRAIIAALDAWLQENGDRAVAVPSLGFARYRAAMTGAAVVLGNSSSGIIEAPSFRVPTVNVGGRQAGRLAATSVRHVAATRGAILEGLRWALSDLGRTAAQTAVNPYGQGNAAGAMLEVLRDAPLPKGLPFYDGGPA
ncbi:MAG: LegC family aminotransferase [Rhodobacteraceae bacterium]|nr:LegC family aminotransferase [Paracoccaceae bacterium]MCF8521045.1 LegC family aminotransferase [Paracoccaceae bacterium]